MTRMKKRTAKRRKMVMRRIWVERGTAQVVEQRMEMVMVTLTIILTYESLKYNERS
ncbi:hypothetical protein ANCCAN_07899 [Ancylostoma caninum]|uniref:Uncharacterized protein n=1 Tax=Ancylostoma caninum TaxID=29170 RepID=A0A368GNT1_ANCCA|nr:hypothetical protein ANCCAN_07899 [Ancylostoma caninum]